jgi:hypothetical protein
MVRSRGSWLAGGAGLLIAGAATAGIATASSAATGAAPAAVQQWRIIFKAPKVSPADQSTQGFTAVVATGNRTKTATLTAGITLKISAQMANASGGM